MAYKVVCSFKDAEGNTINHSITPAGSGVTGAVVKAYMQAAVTNGSIFKRVPTVIVGAKMVQTTETEITLPE